MEEMDVIIFLKKKTTLQLGNIKKTIAKLIRTKTKKY